MPSRITRTIVVFLVLAALVSCVTPPQPAPGSDEPSGKQQVTEPELTALPAATDGKEQAPDQAPDQAPSTQPDAVGVYGRDNDALGTLLDPHGIEETAGGNLLVADEGNQRIQAFDAEGTPIGFITADGVVGQQMFSRAFDVAVSPVSGDIYVMDAGFRAVFRFTRDGMLRGRWGEAGSGPGMFDFGRTGSTIAVGPDGRVYVADSGNGRIQVFSPDGQYLFEFAAENGRPFDAPGGIEVANDGTVCVTENWPGSVQLFDAEGHHLLTIDGIQSAAGVYVHNGEVFCVSEDDSLVRVFATDGSPIGTIDLAAAIGRGKHEFSDILVNQAGEVVVVAKRDDAIYRVSREGELVAAIGIDLDAPPPLQAPSDVAFAPDGSYWIAERDGNRIRKFTAEGEELLVIGGYGSRSGSFVEPSGIAINSRGEVFVTDTGNGRIQVFDSDGEFQYLFSVEPATQRRTRPYGIAIDREDQIYVGDTAVHAVAVFDQDGYQIDMWGEQGSGPGQFANMRHLAVGPDGSIYVADSHDNDRIQRFTADGLFLGEAGEFGNGPGQFWNVEGIATDADEHLFVTDRGFSLHVYDDELNFVGRVGDTRELGMDDLVRSLETHNGVLYFVMPDVNRIGAVPISTVLDRLGAD